MNSILLIFFIMSPLIIFAQDTLKVPEDYSYIQYAIDASKNGDIILVSEGKYYENIKFKGKEITVSSYFFIDQDTSHISKTIIDGSFPHNPDSGSVVSFVNGEDTASVLCGFTITGGSGTYTESYDDISGGGIFLFPSGAKICNNIILGNHVSHSTYAGGGGIMADTDGHNLIIENNTIKNNSVSGNSVTGGGITLFNNNYVRISCNKILNNSADGTNSAWGGGINTNNANNEVSIVNNYIKGNKHRSDGAGGGGLSIYHGLPKVMKNLFIENSAQTGGGMFIDLTGNSVSQASIKKSRGNILIHQNNYKLTDSGAVNSILANNTIIYNTSTVSGGGISIAGQSPQLMNLILWGNESQLDPQVYGPSEVSYSCIEGGLEGQGNISLNPEFMDSINYYLMESSPCIDSGNPDSSHNDIEDPNNPGSALWPALGSLRNDMGAYGGGIFDYVTSADKIYKNIKANNIYTLLQNYPNPFNPATKIKYSIPAEGKGQTLPAGRQGVEVKLVVYDILGREVATLVNEKQKPGNYEIEFNSSSVGFRITSGVYFYKLSTSEYIVTKKMILIK